MISLADIETIRVRQGLQDDEGVITALTSALSSVNPIIEVKLQTLLDAGDYVDTFYLDPQNHYHFGGEYCLKLKNGFVQDEDSVLLYRGDTMASLRGATLPDAVDPSLFRLNAEKGFVYLSEDIASQFSGPIYLRAVYSAGFSSLSQVPAWVQEVALLHTIKMMAAQTVGDGKPELNDALVFLDTQGNFLLAGHMRNSNDAIKAMG